MKVYQQLEAVRAVVKRWIDQQGQVVDVPSESILLKDDRYAGHRLLWPGHHAMWELDAEWVAIYAGQEVVARLPLEGLARNELSPDIPSWAPAQASTAA